MPSPHLSVVTSGVDFVLATGSPLGSWFVGVHGEVVFIVLEVNMGGGLMYDGGYVIGTLDILPMAFAIFELLPFPRMLCHWGWSFMSSERDNEHNFSPSAKLEATSPLSAFHLSHQLFLVLLLLFSFPLRVETKDSPA
jgi:hypothetical protein